MTTECNIQYSTAETLYLGHDNAVTIIPFSDLAARINYDMTDVTAVTVSADLVASVVGGDDVTASTDDVPETVWWNQDAANVWQIHMKVGLFVGITADLYKLRVVIVDPANLNGIVIADDLLADIVDTP